LGAPGKKTSQTPYVKLHCMMKYCGRPKLRNKKKIKKLVEFREFSLYVWKTLKIGKKSPKNQGAPGSARFWNLSFTRGPLSRGTEIAPEYPLGEEIWGVKLLGLPLNSPKMGGRRGPNFAVFETSPRGLPALKATRF